MCKYVSCILLQLYCLRSVNIIAFPRFFSSFHYLRLILRNGFTYQTRYLNYQVSGLIMCLLGLSGISQLIEDCMKNYKFNYTSLNRYPAFYCSCSYIVLVLSIHIRFQDFFEFPLHVIYSA